MRILQNFPQRVRTVLLWAPIPLLLVILSPVTSWFVFTAVAIVGTMEWRKIVTQDSQQYYSLNSRLSIAGVFATMIVAIFNAPMAFIVSMLIAIIISIREDTRKKNMLALAQIVPSFVGIMAYQLRAGDDGLAMIGLVLVITVTSDTAAYFVGRSFGKNKFAPKISPNKTWEGAIGGWVAAILGAWLYVQIFLPAFAALGTPMKILCFWALAFAGQLGDLAESALKRRYDVKDSGNIFPGHGGVLDRFDSFAAVITIIYLIDILVI